MIISQTMKATFVLAQTWQEAAEYKRAAQVLQSFSERLKSLPITPAEKLAWHVETAVCSC